MKSENTDRVRRVIAIEEHAWPPKLREALLHSGDDETVASWSDEATTNRRLLDIGEERLARMDEMGVDFQVLSITAPGVQQLPASLAVALARDANDYLANVVQRQPDRFAAFATLPTPDPTAAADELRRCVDELGFVGAMVFPRTGLDIIDHKRFRTIFLAAAELDVPVYIHPGVPPRAVRDASYSGFSPMTDLMLATDGWGWHAEAGLAALRVILAGTFDRHPNLQLILGHMGEMLVSFADRADALTKTTHLQRSVLDCITGNIYATPGGVFSHPGISHQATGMWSRISARTRTSSTASRMVWRMEFLPVTMRTALSATRLRVARLRGPWPRRTSDASSPMVTSRTQCRLFSCDLRVVGVHTPACPQGSMMECPVREPCPPKCCYPDMRRSNPTCEASGTTATIWKHRSGGGPAEDGRLNASERPCLRSVTCNRPKVLSGRSQNGTRVGSSIGNLDDGDNTTRRTTGRSRPIRISTLDNRVSPTRPVAARRRYPDRKEGHGGGGKGTAEQAKAVL